MTTFRTDLAGKTGKPYGVGMKVVAGEVQLKPLAEAIHAKDMGLKSIHALSLNADWGGTYNYAGSMILAQAAISAPGSVDNYASVSVWQQKKADQTAKTGTFTLQFLAVGE